MRATANRSSSSAAGGTRNVIRTTAGRAGRMASVANPKLQDPSSNHSQTPNPKYNPKIIPNRKSQIPNPNTPTGEGVGVGSWDLRLGLGSWEWLGFGAWSLGFDTSHAATSPC